MKTLQDLYTFYIEHCIDEDKNETPLSYSEWVNNHGDEELEKLNHITS